MISYYSFSLSLVPFPARFSNNPLSSYSLISFTNLFLYIFTSHSPTDGISISNFMGNSHPPPLQTGFQILIEKDWLSVGHKFGTRCGHADSNYASEERSPIFLQFMDCVFQCLQQFPCLFEFNEKYLISIMDNVYSCQFGTFLMNNERERKQANLFEITPSLWNELNYLREQYVNPFYLPGLGVVYPSSYFEDLQLWRGYFLRYCRTANPNQGITADLRGLQLIATNKSLSSQIDLLKTQLSQLNDQIKHLTSQSPVSAQSQVESQVESQSANDLEDASDGNLLSRSLSSADESSEKEPVLSNELDSPLLNDITLPNPSDN